MKHLLIFLIALAFVGCSAQPRHYTTPISKHPTTLALLDGERYELEAYNSDTAKREVEHGQWYRVKESVVALVPNDQNKAERFARISEERSLLGNLTLFDKLRPALNDVPTIENVPLVRPFH